MDPLSELLRTYTELNNPDVQELQEAPSALEFMRSVATNRPFVVRQGVRGWKAVKSWNSEYLQEKLKDQSIRVAITPRGSVIILIFLYLFLTHLSYSNADSPVSSEDGRSLFVKPHEEEQPFEEFLSFISGQELHDSGVEAQEVRYAQSREFKTLRLCGPAFDNVSRK